MVFAGDGRYDDHEKMQGADMGDHPEKDRDLFSKEECMAIRILMRNWARKVAPVGLVGGMLCGVVGCAGETPKSSAPSVTPDHVRSHADKAFGSLKQEERHQGGEPGGTTH